MATVQKTTSASNLAVTPWALPFAFEPMRQYPQWFIYRLHDRDPATCKYKKQPIDPRTRAKPLEAHGGINQCTDFETVARVGAEMQAAAKPGERYVPGFYFTENDPFAFFDIDKCVVTVDGNAAWSPLALELLGQFPQAARETSSRGRGWHVIATTTVPPSKGRKNGEHNLEFYARDRGAALTFENVSGNAGADETQAFEAIRARYFPAKAVDESAEWTDASNNYAERCMRTVAVGRKAFLFVGSERAGHAAAIYYSLVESCKANKVNPLTYLTYVLANARNKSIVLPTPDEFTASNIAHVG